MEKQTKNIKTTKKTIFFLSLLITQIIYAMPPQPNKPNPMLKGVIVSQELKTMPTFKFYYQGMQTTNNADGFFSFPIEKITDDYALIICKDFQPRFNTTNTIEKLTLNTEKPYLYYKFKKITLTNIQEKIDTFTSALEQLSVQNKLIDLQIKKQKQQLKLSRGLNLKTRIDEQTSKIKTLTKKQATLDLELANTKKQIESLKQQYVELQNKNPNSPTSDHWFISKMKINRKEFTVPDNCIVACINPKTVSQIQNWNFTLAPNFVSFPQIILKDNLETKNIKGKHSIVRSSIKSKIYAMEKEVFHESTQEVCKNEENVCISLIQ